jgi:23S rRNA pseudouridine1911/1915/1917 synthase
MLSSLRSHCSLNDFLLSYFSKNKIKKFFSKKELNRAVMAQSFIDVPIALRNYMHINPDYEGADITIIYQNDRFVVLDKPCGVATHPLSYQDKNNLLSFLRSRNIFAPLFVNSNTHERGLLYRLDTATSGVVVLQNHELENVRKDYCSIMEKYYLAIVQGIPRDGKLVDTVTSSGKKIRQSSSGGKEVKLDIKVLESIGNLSLVLIKLITGFRHQIRFQLSSRGHPILGDALYQGMPSSRMFLHAYCYRLKLRGEFEFISSNLDDFYEFFPSLCFSSVKVEVFD